MTDQRAEAALDDTLSGRHPAAKPTPTAYRYYVVGVLGLFSFFSFMDRSVLAVLVEPIKADLGISDTQIGLLSGFSFAIFYASFGIPLARLADRRSRVTILAVAITFWSLVTALSGAARNFVQLLFARIGLGVGEAALIPCTHSLISDYFPPNERAFALSAFQAAGIAGTTLGLAFAGFVAEALGWRLAFVVVGLPGLLVGLLAWLTLREPERGVYSTVTERTGPPQNIVADLKILFSQRTYPHLLAGLAITAFSTQGLVAWTPAFFIRVHDLSVAQAGYWTGLSAGVGGVSGLLIGGVAAASLVRRDRRWECWLPLASLALGLPLYLLAFLHPSTSIALAANFTGAFASSFGYGMGLASFHGVTPSNLRGLAASLVMFGTALIGLGAGPFVIGVLSDLFASDMGQESLRYAIVISIFFKLWAIFHFARAATTIRQDILS